MPHRAQSKADTYVIKHGSVPLNDSFYGKVIILRNFLEKVQNIF